MTKKYIVNSQSEFDNAIDRRANQILDDYKKLKVKKYKTTQKNKFKNDLRKRYEEIEIDQKFIGVFYAIQIIDQELDEGQTYFDAIKIYLKTTKLKPNEVLEYLIEYNGTIQAMINKIPDYDREDRRTPKKIEQTHKDLTVTFILNNHVLSKIDFIRLINSLWEIKALKNKDGLYPTKEATMTEFGRFVGIDLSSYETLLSKAANTTDIETNSKIFDTLKEKMINYCNNKVSKNKNK